MTELINNIRRRLPELELLENEPMSRHCSFKIGGPARALAIPSCTEELAALLNILSESDARPLVIGNGTNLLVTDRPLERFVIKLGEKLSAIELVGETLVCAQAGVTLARLASFCADRGLAGMEFAHGIPGALGGGVSMNAGAYGGELKDAIKSARYLDGSGILREISVQDMKLGYRHSIFSESDKVLVDCVLSLQPGNPDEIKAKMRELAEKRRASQPLDKPSAGSTFKRPVGGYAAALIDQAGLKGFSIGGAQVSEKHAGFVINKGGATCDDVLSLMAHIKKTVYESSGITLEPEVKIIDNAR